MDKLFGISMNAIMAVLVGIVALALLTFAFAALRNPVLFKMGLRNIPRRRAQTVIIVFGLMVSTLIIAAAFTVGDSLNYSITKSAYDDLGAVDLQVQTRSVGGKATAGAPYVADTVVSTVEQQVGDQPELLSWLPGIDEPVPASNPRTRLTEPRFHLIGADPAAVERAGGLRNKASDSVQLSALGAGEAYVNATAADKLDILPGDTIQTRFGNQPISLTVKGIVRDQVLSGWQDIGAGDNGGIVMPLTAVRQIVGKPDQVNRIFVSTSKDAHAGLQRGEKLFPSVKRALDTDAVKGQLDNGGMALKAQNSKHDFVRTAELLGSSFTTLFIVIGLFSIAAGMMLIFLIFVMLAAERRPEMGMARAVGISRLGLVQSFLAEGMVYNLLAGVVGAALGIGVAFGIIWIAAHLIFTGNFTLPFVQYVSFRSVVVSYCLGVALTFITVTFSAYRTTRMQIVAAIRDMPEDSVGSMARRRANGINLLSSIIRFMGGIFSLAFLTTLFGQAWAAALFTALIAGAHLLTAAILLRPNWWSVSWRILIGFIPGVPTVWSILGFLRSFGLSWSATWSIICLILGLLSLASCHAAGSLFLFTAGVSLTLLGLALIARVRGVANRAAFTTFGVFMLIFWLLPGHVIKDTVGGLYKNDSGGIEMFFLSGIMLVLSTTLILVFNGELLAHAVTRLGGGLGSVRPSLATAIAYPLASKLRTGLTLAMFSLIIFSITVMSSLNSNFTRLFASGDATGGWDVTMQTNLNNTVGDPRAQLAQNGVDISKIAAIGGTTPYAGTTDVRLTDVTGFQRYFVRAANAEFLNAANMKLQAHLKGIPNDQIWKTLQQQPDTAVIDAGALGGRNGGDGGDGPNFTLKGVSSSVKVLDHPIDVVIRDALGKRETTLHIIGIVNRTVQGAFATIFTSGDTYREALSEPAFSQFYVRLTSGTNDKTYAKSIKAALAQFGVQASAIRSNIADQLAISKGIGYLYEGFMGLGLFVGIAAVAVIAARNVVERRQQIGMLRAVGYKRGQIALSFALETSFISLFGIGAGVVTAAILSFNLFTGTTFGDTGSTGFVLPWGQIVLFAGIGYVASLLMTYFPSRRAAALPIAEALRYE